MSLLRRCLAAVREVLNRIRPQDVPDGNPEYL